MLLIRDILLERAAEPAQAICSFIEWYAAGSQSAVKVYDLFRPRDEAKAWV